jgi:hypothetical protein
MVRCMLHYAKRIHCIFVLPVGVSYQNVPYQSRIVPISHTSSETIQSLPSAILLPRIRVISQPDIFER